jgi:sterol desaturase/sphingolipid hydroxylase (fatty acid hydroxylase superfamily)
MHHKRLYKYLHKGHHDSVEVSSWTAFSFAPLETVLQVLPFYVISFMIPLHLYSVGFLLLFMSVSATINHLNYEIYPKFFRTNFPFSLLIGATHHALHHKEFKTNYGLYFTFWDKWMNTESKDY